MDRDSSLHAPTARPLPVGSRPHVHDHHPPPLLFRAQHQIAQLHVAMHNLPLMQCLEAISQLTCPI